MPHPVVHFEIGCRDRDATAKFYEDVFGWTTTPTGDLTRDIATNADAGVQGHMTALGHEPHNYVLIYIQVDDVEAAIEKVEDAGGANHIGPLPTPQGGAFAWVKDPAGNMLGLIASPES
jgi:predicted enzyme related to lactoylglutathione lyase